MEWPVHSLRGTLTPPWLELVLVLAAIVCGTIVGTERERHDKPAGLRTLILVCFGSTMFTLVSFGLKLGKLGPAVRIALTGGTVSPGLFDVISVLGCAETVTRLRSALVVFTAALKTALLLAASCVYKDASAWGVAKR